ncbi:hypothetical protein [Pseudomonas sp. BMS12]|uniref:hypothetical protein n=1 Tax=Pseudomonas sp. BMS12 TaxID=1796033 RepID=UPI00083ACA48|nr:hypothetical protein [Pseudomonas sp. BMS12]
MKPLHLLPLAALLFVLGLVTGLSWPSTSARQQDLTALPAPSVSLAQRADLLQARRQPRWVF